MKLIVIFIWFLASCLKILHMRDLHAVSLKPVEFSGSLCMEINIAAFVQYRLSLDLLFVFLNVVCQEMF